MNVRERNSLSATKSLKSKAKGTMEVTLFLGIQHNLSRGPRHGRGSKLTRALLTWGDALAVPFLAPSSPEAHSAGFMVTWSSAPQVIIWETSGCSLFGSKNPSWLNPRVTGLVQNADSLPVCRPFCRLHI